jgi:hypothetical protein
MNVKTGSKFAYSIFLMACASLYAQVDGSHWPVKGDTQDQVQNYFGKADYVIPAKHPGHFVWFYYSKESEPGNIRVTFKDSLVFKVQREQQHNSKGAAIAQVAVQIATQLYLTQVCPQLYSKPLLFWTAGESQIWQACISQGWFLGRWYIYTGTN